MTKVEFSGWTVCGLLESAPYLCLLLALRHRRCSCVPTDHSPHNIVQESAPIILIPSFRWPIDLEELVMAHKLDMNFFAFPTPCHSMVTYSLQALVRLDPDAELFAGRLVCPLRTRKFYDYAGTRFMCLCSSVRAGKQKRLSHAVRIVADHIYNDYFSVFDISNR